MQAAIYARISRDREGAGLGVDRQRADCEAMAERLGWTVAAVYTDDDVSAYSGKARPAYRDMMAAVEAGTVQGILAWHPDRLHRSPVELEAFIAAIEAHGVAVQTATAGVLDLGTATGRMSARIVGAVARHESEHKSERIRRKVDELVARGEPPDGGFRPFGYRRVLDARGNPTKPPTFEIVPDEAEAIREAARLLLDGRSLRSVIADWRERGILSPAGKPWRQTALGRTLSGSFIAGLRERHTDADPRKRAARTGQVTYTEGDPQLWPPILDRRTWERLRALLRAPGRRKSASNARVNLLAGMLHCGRCGRVLVGRSRKVARFPSDAKRRYVCPPTTMSGCGKLAILAAETEAEIVAQVLARLDSPAVRNALEAQAADASDPSVLVEQAAAQDRMAELAAEYAAGTITRTEWQAARAVLVERIASAEGAVGAAAVRSTRRVPADVATAWPGLDMDARRRILAAVVECITIAGAVPGRNRFDPDRVAVSWRA
jgi:site-specific DNA recombinase